jgi:hypothetical protein
VYFNKLVEAIKTEQPSVDGIFVHLHGAEPDYVSRIIRHTAALCNAGKCPRFYFIISGHFAEIVERQLVCESVFDTSTIEIAPHYMLEHLPDIFQGYGYNGPPPGMYFTSF